MMKDEFVFGIGEVVRFVSDPDIKAIVTGIVMRPGGASFIVSDKGQETECGVEELMEEDAWISGGEDDEQQPV